MMKNIIKQIKVLILDFDGVVIESNNVKTAAFQHVFAGFPEYSDQMMRFHHENVSLSRFVKFRHLLSLLGKADDMWLLNDLSSDFSKSVLEGMSNVPLVNGAEDFLTNVSSTFPVYLASVTPADELEIILKKRGLSHWFKKVYGCPPWNKPDAVSDVLQLETAKPEEAMLIGDSAGDQNTATQTGVHFIARNSGLPFVDPQPVSFDDLKSINDLFRNCYND